LPAFCVQFSKVEKKPNHTNGTSQYPKHDKDSATGGRETLISIAQSSNSSTNTIDSMGEEFLDVELKNSTTE